MVLVAVPLRLDQVVAPPFCLAVGPGQSPQLPVGLQKVADEPRCCCDHHKHMAMSYGQEAPHHQPDAPWDRGLEPSVGCDGRCVCPVPERCEKACVQAEFVLNRTPPPQSVPVLPDRCDDRRTADELRDRAQVSDSCGAQSTSPVDEEVEGVGPPFDFEPLDSYDNPAYATSHPFYQACLAASAVSSTTNALDDSIDPSPVKAMAGSVFADSSPDHSPLKADSTSASQMPMADIIKEVRMKVMEAQGRRLREPKQEKRVKEACRRPVAPCEADSWSPDTTSVMMCNIPSRYDVEELLVEIVGRGFESTFDYFYLPMDFRSKHNMGYAFINFREHDTCKRFAKALHGQQLQRFQSDKIIEVKRAVRQGFQALLDSWAKKDSHRVRNPLFRPLIFT